MSVFYESITQPQLAEAITSGQTGILPTDTLYGLVCQAGNRAAVERLYNIKLREHKPGTVIAASIDQLVGLGIKRRYLTAVDQYWPGAVSVVIPVGADLGYLCQGLRTIAVRVTNSPGITELLQVTGPLLTTSANHPGAPPANNISEAQAVFDETVDFYVDGGDLSARQPSTVIRVIDDAVDVLRLGAVKVPEN